LYKDAPKTTSSKVYIDSLRCLCQNLQSFALGIDSNENDENAKKDIQTLIEKKVSGR
jgi:hypothetical protein